MALAQNDVGKPVPGGGSIRDETKKGMNITTVKVANPPSGQFGVGSGSGVLDGGTLSPRDKGKRR